MTPKEKAREFVNIFMQSFEFTQAKEYAISEVNKKFGSTLQYTSSVYNYWYEVLLEIKNLEPYENLNENI